MKAYIIQGFTQGFRLGSEGDPSSNSERNHTSTKENPRAVKTKLDKELSLKRISHPSPSKPFENLICSPLGLIPKKMPGEFRIIHDLSFPSGSSVNDQIPECNSKVHYESIEDIIKLVKKFGRNSLMAKTDIEDGFRNIPIHPLDYHLLGFKWDNMYYFDKCLPMGASSSCQIFEKISTALQWIMMEKYNASGMSHLIDDFFFIGPPASDKCQHDLENFEALCERIGVPLKSSKTVHPTKVITIYGIEIDSTTMEARLPQEKLEKLRSSLEAFSRRKNVTLKELQSLIGLLNFACLVVTPGRAFLRRLIDLTCKVTNQHHFLRLNSEARLDIKAWQIFIENFNGKSVFLSDEWLSSDRICLYTDASGKLGYAAVLGSQWFTGSWTQSHEDYQIAIKELFPIVLALEIWGHKLKNHKILFLSDNIAVVEIINKQSSKDQVIMRLVRRLVLCALQFNIFFRAKHISGKSNVIPDRLSRFKFQEAKSLAPWLNQQPTTIPPNLIYI